MNPLPSLAVFLAGAAPLAAEPLALPPSPANTPTALATWVVGPPGRNPLQAVGGWLPQKP